MRSRHLTPWAAVALLVAAAAVAHAAASTLTVPVTIPAGADTAGLLVPLPPGSERYVVTDGEGEMVAGERSCLHLRGRPVALVAGAPGAPLAVRVTAADKSASPSRLRRFSRRFDRAVAAALAGDGAQSGAADAGDGAYVIVTASSLVEAVAPLAEWKRQQGWRVVVATTDETGTLPADIRDWLRDAAADWDVPPELVLLAGDVAQVPAWTFSENVTDLPYSLLDDDDWLPDLLVGRLPGATPDEMATMVAKTVAYVRDPERDDPGWFTRQLAVAGNYGSETPISTVTWCAGQLQELGFDPPTEVFFPPLWNGVYPITQAIDAGVGMVVYRGWAYGINGWEPPHFTVAEIPSLENGGMTPVVMSFVCLTGNFAADTDCFGETFLKTGSPDDPSGAVAFIGNGEHWSHTRYNDAMAVSVFEMLPQPGVVDLGGLLLAGKLRFLQYFPHELDAAAHGEESVEFYFHIYNLLGDPGLEFWKQAPREMAVTAPQPLPAGQRRLPVQVTDAGDGTPVAGARVGVTAAGERVGGAWTGADGRVEVLLDGIADDGPLLLTVTAPGRLTRQLTLSRDDDEPLVWVSLAWQDQDGDGLAEPGESVLVRPELRNTGESPVSSLDISLAVDGPATVTTASLAVGSLAPGETWSPPPGEGLACTVAPDAAPGAPLTLLLSAQHAGGASAAGLALHVAAPVFRADGAVTGADGWLRQGAADTVAVVLTETAGVGCGGGNVTAALADPTAGSLLVDAAAFGPVPAGGQAVLEPPLVLQAAAGVPSGTVVTLNLTVVTAEGVTATVPLSLTVGRVDPGAPVAPDGHGYRAVDCADIDYPGLRPQYRWRELDPALGGDGTPLVFTMDDAYASLPLPFPVTFYGRTYTDSVRVSEDGWISFDTGTDLMYYNWPLPDTYGVGAVVAPFWDNFDPTLPGTGGVFHRHDPAAGTWTIEWSAMRHYRPEVDAAQTFQLVVRDPAVWPTPTGDAEFLFLYRQTVDVDSLRQFASVGLESPDEQDGLQLAYAGRAAPGQAPIGPGLAVLVTTRVPVYDPYRADLTVLAGSGGSVRLAWRPRDDRPVSGWLVQRLDAAGRVAFTSPLLPAAAREWSAAGAAGTGDAGRWRLVSVHPYGHRGVAAEAAAAPAGVLSWRVGPVRPNPAPGGTRIGFALPRAAPVRLRIYDAAGRLVRTLLDGTQPAGPGDRVWDGLDAAGRPAPAGVYFTRLEGPAGTAVARFLLVR